MKRSFFCLAIYAIVFASDAYCALPEERPLRIGNTTGQESEPNGIEPYFFADFDAAGYSDDGIYYGFSHRHDYTYHELLSGEWGAALYYDGIDTPVIDPNNPSLGRKAMWLTNLFKWPNWQTNSNFIVEEDPDTWNNPENPSPYINTAHSTIIGDKTTIDITYEVVDLGPDVDEDLDGSPMAFWLADPNDPYNPEAGDHVFVRSDRYLILQTYTIQNTDPNHQTLDDIEFYQMLHAHPADMSGDVVTVTYDNSDYWADPLANYIPFDSNHEVGDFCFDLTFWNDGNPSTSHVDWVGFSCTVEPNWIDTELYEGGHSYATYKPPKPGTHWNIEERNLNGEVRLHGQVAGAIGWSLGSLGPNETTSITVAFMFGTGPIKTMADIYLPLRVEIEDDATVCVSPCPSEKTLTIDYSYLWNIPGWEAFSYSPSDVEDLELTCYLPPEADFVSADPNEGYYNSDLHAYVWYIGDLTGGEDDTVDISVSINSSVIPGGELISSVVAEYTVSGIEYSQETEHTTAVCECDCGSIIYVDQDATAGGDDGTSWTNAYLKLQDALAEADVCDQIWVAEGTYKPAVSFSESATFTIPNGVKVYGGFDGTESYAYERNWADPNNETILSGLFDPNEVDFVVTADSDVRWAILDGFTIKQGVFAGVYCEGSSLHIEHNKFTDNGFGIYCYETLSPIIRNNWIYENTIGMSFENLQDIAIVRNNTVVDNDPMGVYCDSDIEPSIKNCIFWGHADANDLIGCYATFSCIEFAEHLYDYTDPNNPVDLGIAGQGNIEDDPLFETGDYHLSSVSPCIDAGDPNETYYHQRDIDKQFRVLYEWVDMGADEYYDCDYVLAADFNEDGIVNFPDYGEFAQHWLKTDSDPNWDSSISYYDLAGDDKAIDVNDLALFADEWLWMDCETMISFPMPEQGGIDETYEMMMMKSSGSSAYGLEKAQAEPTLKEQIDHAKYIIDFLERIWKYDKQARKTIDEKDWEVFIDKVYEWFYLLEDQALGAKE